MAAPPIAWTPSPERIASATITRYREWLSETRGLALDDYADLWQWSVDELEDFWRSIWEFFEVDASEPYERVLTTREMPGARWFPGARLSYAEHVFRRRADDEVAIRHASELRPLAEWTWGELRAGSSVVVDLSGLGFMDSQGLRLFLQLALYTEQRKLGPVVLVNPSRAVRRVLEISLPHGLPGLAVREERT